MPKVMESGGVNFRRAELDTDFRRCPGYPSSYACCLRQNSNRRLDNWTSRSLISGHTSSAGVSRELSQHYH